MSDKFHDAADDGYHKGLKSRHIQMIAIGGAIGTGFLLGTGGRLQQGGPGLAIAYAVCGLVAFIMVRAMGELSIRRPSAGAFVSYAREFHGEKAAYVTGWLFFMDWAVTVMADITAVALFMHYWPAFQGIPQWVLATGALLIVMLLNIASVKAFGEFEFWLAAVKVGAILLFMAVAIWAVVTGANVGDHTAGLHNFTREGGLLPMGVLPLVTLSMGVVFAFGGTEMVGVTAGETQDAKTVLPKAINSMILRIGVFYVGTIILMTLVLPWWAYSADESPFVTVFSALGVPHAGDVMQIVVLTATLSSLNAGLYATGRTLRSMAVAGEAPKMAKKLNKNKVPMNAIILTSALGLIGVLINYLHPTHAFEIVMNLAAIGIAGTWISILITHMTYVRRTKRGEEERGHFRLHFAPWTNLLAIAFLLVVIIGMWFDPKIGRATLYMFAGFCVLLVLGWFAVRKRIHGELLDEAFEDTLV